MKSYAIFLRGVNVAGITVKMTDLAKALGKLPLVDIRTILASGNVVCKSAASAARVKSQVEECLRKTFGYEAWVVVLPGERVDALVAACPFPPGSTSHHAYVTLGSSDALDELYAAGTKLAGTELVRLGPEAIAWQAPVGGTLDVPFSKLSAKPKFKASTTTRNLRTLVKVSAAATAR